MKVILIHIDGKRPNPALMKISGHHKKLGDQVALIKMNGPDLELFPFKPNWVYASCIFKKNKGYALRMKDWLKSMNLQGLQIGGPGLGEDDIPLPNFIEHTCPDYDLYGINYSIGFTSRGCIRRCPWCDVWKREGYIRDHAPLSEFLRHDKLILYDGNFLASPKWKDNLIEIIARHIKVDFNQGLDIRLIDQENARLLSKCHYFDWNTGKRRLRFSFDLPQIEDDVLQSIKILEKLGIPRKHLMFYVLVGFNTTYEEDLHRIKLLIDEGVKPYVMPYNDRHDSYYPHLERWTNGRYYQVTPWKEYDHGNSQEIISAL